MRHICILAVAAFLFLTAAPSAAIASEEEIATTKGLLTAGQLLEHCRPSMLPLDYTVTKDEIVASDTVPSKRLRRIEVKFYSMELDDGKWGHPSVIYMPADPTEYRSPGRRGKVVIVARDTQVTHGPLEDAFLGNYGEPIAARTGYPTMVCPIPGTYDGDNGRELDIGLLARRQRKTSDPVDNGYVRLGIPYLYAMDVMAEILEIDQKEVRAVIGGHSKRVAAYCAAAMDPERVAGVIYMGNESGFGRSRLVPPLAASYPPHTQQWVKAPVLYIGGTNEDGYKMFNINKMWEQMGRKWTIEMIPNYRHAAFSEKHFIDWAMWIAHCFEKRPITKITALSHEDKGPDFKWLGRRHGGNGGTLFRCKLDTPNKIIQAKVWYVYCDDVPHWRDLMWYPELMFRQPDGSWATYVIGKTPDAWLIEVKDIAGGYAGYVSTVPQDLTGKKTKRRTSRGSRSRNWEPKP